jgi:hypothetical protein
MFGVLGRSRIQMDTSLITYDRPKLEVNYDFVWIIDGLVAEQSKGFGLTRAVGDQLRKAGFSFNLTHCHSKQHLLDTLQQLSREASGGAKFAIQFICHGVRSKQSGKPLGLRMGTELVRWNELSEPLRQVNHAMAGDLILNMTACFGINAIKAVGDLGQPYPFFGLLGPKRAVKIREALWLNRQIYARWFAGQDFSPMIKAINEAFGSEIIFIVSAEGYDKIAQADR